MYLVPCITALIATMSLKNKTCLVTGASSGIGKAICQVLATHGAAVVGTGRNEASLQELVQNKVLVGYIMADLTKSGECERVVNEALSILVPQYGQTLTTVVNAAGVLQGGAVGAPQTDVSNYHYNMQINTQVPFEIMVHAIPFLRKNNAFPGQASIVNISSVNGKQSFAGCASYCMSKAALDQLTKCASVDLAADGIRVNAVNPGVIETNLQKAGGMTDTTYAAFLERSQKTTHPIAAALGRVGQPEEVGELVAFLVSDKCKFLTGECIVVDGGRQNLGAR